MERIAYRIDEVLELVGIGRTKLYDIINAGDLPARKVGKKTVILAADLKAWLESLPPVSTDYDESHEAKRGG